MNTAATAIIGHTYGHTGHIPTVCVAVVVAICATPATFVAAVAGVATASVWDLRSSILSSRVFAASPVDAVSLTAKGLSAPNPTKEDGSLPLRLSETNTIASFASRGLVNVIGPKNAGRSENRDPRLRNPSPVQIAHHYC